MNWFQLAIANSLSVPLRLLLAVSCVVVAIALCQIVRVPSDTLFYITFYPAVAVASMLGGLWSGLAALTLSMFFFGYVVLPPSPPWRDVAGLIIYGTFAMAFVFGGEAVRNGYRRLVRQCRSEKARADLMQVFLRAARHCIRDYLERFTILLRTHRETFSDQAAQQRFDETINQLDALKHFYQRLYASDELTTGPIGQMLHDICRDLVCASSCRRVRVDVQCQPLLLRHEQKVALGLVVAELVTYALEREQCEPGTIEVSLEVENAKAQLMVRDMRVLPEAKPHLVPGEFELMLTRLLASHLNGSVRFKHNATQVTFTFSLADPEA